MKFVLSIDGGGIRGIIPALVLDYLETKLNRPIGTIFDLIAGTSTGGILALGLAKTDDNKEITFTSKELAEIYEKRGREIFNATLWRNISSVSGIADEKYGHDGLEKLLLEYFGKQSLKEVATKVLVTSYDIQNRAPLFFKSWKSDTNNTEMRHIARATSAAPTYFEPANVPVNGSMKPLVDGGIFVNNPSVSAYVEAKRIFPNEEIFVLSLGTGELIRPIDVNEAKDWGKAGWLVPLLDCMFDGVSDAANYQMKHLLGEKYVRLQTTLGIASDDMDDVSAGNIHNLVTEANKLIKDSEHTLNQLVDTIKNYR